MVRTCTLKVDKAHIADIIAHEKIRGMHLIDILKIGPLISGDHFSWHIIALDITLAWTLRALVYCC